MKLAIDIREACRIHPAGKGRWTYGFLVELLERKVPLVLYSDAHLPRDLAHKASHCDVRIIPVRGIWWHIAVARDVRREPSIDAYVSTVSYIVPCLLRRKIPVITVVHDLIALRSEPHNRRSTFIERLTLGTALRYSARICTVSYTTAKDLLARFPSLNPDRVIPIFAGCDVPLSLTVSRGEGCILCIGTLCPRKNQLRLIQAHALLPETLRCMHPLVLAGGRGWNDEAIVHAAATTPHVCWIGSCSDAERSSLLKQAVLCAFPSLYEGFGLPVLEAFASGVAVVASVGGSLREIAGDAAFMVDPLSSASITVGLQSMLEQADLRRMYAEKGLLRAREYTWKKSVDLFLEAAYDIDRKV